MTLNEVISLVNAGFTKGEIVEMQTYQQAQQPYPQAQAQTMPQAQQPYPQVQAQTMPQAQQPYPQAQAQTMPQAQQTYPQAQAQTNTSNVDVLSAIQRFNRDNATFDAPPQRTSHDILNESLCFAETGMSVDAYMKKGEENGK